jgi:hypothetical protein
MIRPRVLPRPTAARSLFAATLVLVLLLGCQSKSALKPAAPLPLPPGTPGTWQDLGLSTGFVEVEALTTWNGSLIAGGTFYGVQGYPSTSLAAWDGATWARLGPNFGGAVYALAVYNGHLIAGGGFPHINGDTIRYVGEWDGIKWKPLGSGPNRSVTSLAVIGNDLYVGGTFDMVDGLPVGYIARWDGTTWHALSGGLNSTPWALTAYQGQLIAGGSFDKADGALAPGIAAWNGSSWSSIGGGVGGGFGGNPYGTVYALVAHGDSLIAGGGFTTAGGVPAYHVAKWNGAQWDSLAGGVGQYSYEYVKSLADYADTLVVGGTFPGNVRRWDGSAWTGMSSLNGHVGAMTVYDGWLIAGGYFPREGAQEANGIARWVK